ncbi:hypothetical protein V9K67_00560 [Paraflavisolibacter sp. H34]|uniref:hypothetical protein n=1 Tax=Huijunlia imazamoxiresistens TaxID=3127457 RepID=UPI00301AAEF3
MAQLDEKREDVILPGITAEQLRALPEYVEDHFPPEVETSVRNVFSGAAAAAGTTLVGTDTGNEADFYNHSEQKAVPAGAAFCVF